MDLLQCISGSNDLMTVFFSPHRTKLHAFYCQDQINSEARRNQGLCVIYLHSSRERVSLLTLKRQTRTLQRRQKDGRLHSAP